jgi:hypothetical protein
VAKNYIVGFYFPLKNFLSCSRSGAVLLHHLRALDPVIGQKGMFCKGLSRWVMGEKAGPKTACTALLRGIKISTRYRHKSNVFPCKPNIPICLTFTVYYFIPRKLSHHVASRSGKQMLIRAKICNKEAT